MQREKGKGARERGEAEKKGGSSDRDQGVEVASGGERDKNERAGEREREG